MWVVFMMGVRPADLFSQKLLTNDCVPTSVASPHLPHPEFFRLHAQCLGPCREQCCNQMIQEENKRWVRPKRFCVSFCMIFTFLWIFFVKEATHVPGRKHLKILIFGGWSQVKITWSGGNLPIKRGTVSTIRQLLTHTNKITSAPALCYTKRAYPEDWTMLSQTGIMANIVRTLRFRAKTSKQPSVSNGKT
jgi:hypothetical protein